MGRDDDGDGNLIALFVLDEIPVATIDEILHRNYERHDANIWPADVYDTIQDYDGSIPQVALPLHSDWRSPFVGKSVPEVVAFMRNSSLDEGCVFICKSLRDEVQQEHKAADEDETEREGDLDTNSDIGEGHGPRFMRIMKAMKATINRRKRTGKVECLSGKVDKGAEKKTKPKHEDDYEDTQLVPTSADRISLFLDGVEHQRRNEFFSRWQENQVWIS